MIDRAMSSTWSATVESEMGMPSIVVLSAAVADQSDTAMSCFLACIPSECRDGSRHSLGCHRAVFADVLC